MIKLFKSPLKNLVAITALLLVIIVSCKKDGINDENLTEAQRIANAKDWYQKTTAKIELKSSRKVENVTQQVSWADAKLYKQADGSEIIGVPVEIGLSNGTKAKGSYLLMISKTGDTYKPVISFNEKKNYFVENIVSSKIKDWYNDATKPNNSHKNTLLNNTGKGKVMVVEGGNMDCTAWFLTETYYDEEGNVIQYYEHYMYTICQPLIDGGEGGLPTDPEEEEDDDIDWGDVTDVSSFTPLDTAALDLENVTEISKVFYWGVYSAPGGIEFTAKQKLYAKKEAIVFWTVDHLDNEGIASTGSSTDSRGRTVSTEVISWTDQSSWRWAKGKLKFKDIRTKMKAGIPKVKYREYTKEGGWESHKIFN